MRAFFVIGLVAAAIRLTSPASADGLVPRGFTFTYRALADTNVTMKLVFDLEPSDVTVGVADSSFTIPGVIRAVWKDEPYAGLVWFFTDSDTVAASNDVLIHGFARPGLGSVLFEAGLAVPTETFPQVWAPAVLQNGTTWSWTGRGICADYDQDRTQTYQASQETIEIPYRGAWTSFQIQVNEPVVCGQRLPDGRAVDSFGRVVPDGVAGKIAEPRWVSAVSTSSGRWVILLKDAFVELVEAEFDGDPIVPTAQATLSDLKNRFRR